MGTMLTRRRSWNFTALLLALLAYSIIPQERAAAVRAPARPTAQGSPLQVYIDWPANPEIGLRGYNVFRTTVDEAGNTLDDPIRLTNSPVESLEFIDDTIVAGVFYVYHVEAVDSRGNRSAPSPLSEPPVKGQWLTVFFPNVNHQTGGLYLWEDRETNRDLVRIPVAVQCAYDVNVTGMQIVAHLPMAYFSKDSFQVELTGITDGMAIGHNILSQDDAHVSNTTPEGMYEVRIVSIDSSGRTLFGAGELFSIYMEPVDNVEPPCASLTLVDHLITNDGTRLYDDPLSPPLPLEVVNGQFCTLEGIDEACLHGDTTDDGVVNRDDAQQILDHITGRSPANEDHFCFPQAWDINLDGRVNTQDATLILRYVENKPINPPRDKAVTSPSVEDSFARAAQEVKNKAASRPQVWVNASLDSPTQITARLMIEGAAPLAGFSATIAFVTEDLEYDEATLGADVDSTSFILSDNVEVVSGANSVLTLATVGVDSLRKNTLSELAVISFRRSETAAAAEPVVLHSFVMNDPYGHSPRHTDPMAPTMQKGLPIPASVFCQVKDEDTFAPIRNATLSLDATFSPITDNVDGVYTFTALPGGVTYTFTAQAPGYHPKTLQHRVDFAQIVDLLFYLKADAPVGEGEGEGEGETAVEEGEEEGESPPPDPGPVGCCRRDESSTGSVSQQTRRLLVDDSAPLLLAFAGLVAFGRRRR